MGLNNITCRIGISAIGNRMAAKAKEYRYELEVRLMGAYCDLLAETDVTPVKKRALTKQMDNLERCGISCRSVMQNTAGRGV